MLLLELPRMPKDSSVQGKVNGTCIQKQTTFYAESKKWKISC